MIGDAHQIARDIRDDTTEICIRTIESLKSDSQGLTLDPATIDACIAILRNLKTLGSAANDKGDRN